MSSSFVVFGTKGAIVLSFLLFEFVVRQIQVENDISVQFCFPNYLRTLSHCTKQPHREGLEGNMLPLKAFVSLLMDVIILGKSHEPGSNADTPTSLPCAENIRARMNDKVVSEEKCDQ
ncbi:uncharacterized protein MYCGRDRAFT_88643 [Zymoseptoria tritici IPO323]|uniref:Uncharacterized protein n=1 Tax=Zymoseptoria tritici (strain CBS 115943 / IPO323) TaxID=336722 RepID=F9WZH6_ZYMTI|nr:uncharacterized protein MYCGRDRAFT_88643 [Zymoseptoria tritici IPO323]EGP92757.1 hypothetical protein MYCGRDRAFT_88643 [Zymoseptoria tritici IPO323]